MPGTRWTRIKWTPNVLVMLSNMMCLCRVTPARCIWTKGGWPSRQATPSSGDSQLLSRTKSKSSRGVILYIMIILWPLKGWAGGPYAYVKVWDADIINPNPVNGNKYVNNVTSVEVNMEVLQFKTCIRKCWAIFFHRRCWASVTIPFSILVSILSFSSWLGEKQMQTQTSLKIIRE